MTQMSPTWDADGGMHASKEIVGNVAVLTVHDVRLDGTRGMDLRRLVAQMVREGHRSIVIDLGAVSFIDSTGLGGLVASLKLATRNGDLTLCGISTAVGALLRLTRLDRVFRSFPVRSDALVALTLHS